MSNIMDRHHDRAFADLVNDLTGIGKKYYRAGQLRENLSQRVAQFRLDMGQKQLTASEQNYKEVIVQLVVCRDLNGAIGLENGLPWEQQTDMKYFRRATINTALIMGSSTFASMDHVGLKDRFNIVVTSKHNENNKINKQKNVAFAKDLAQAMALAKIRARTLCPDNPRVSIVGGGMIYREAIRQGVVHVVRETVVQTRTVGADTYFDPTKTVASHLWQKVHTERRFTNDEDQYEQVFNIYAHTSLSLNVNDENNVLGRLKLGHDSFIGLPPKSK